MTMLYTTYLDEPVESPFLRSFKGLFSRGSVPAAKFRYQYFDEQPVAVAPEECAENTTLEKAVFVDRYAVTADEFLLTRFSSEKPHHVHLKFDEYPNLGTLAQFDNVLIQQNLGKLPRLRIIVTVFLPRDAEQVVRVARVMRGYAGAVADQLLVDKLGSA